MVAERWDERARRAGRGRRLPAGLRRLRDLPDRSCWPRRLVTSDTRGAGTRGPFVAFRPSERVLSLAGTAASMLSVGRWRHYRREGTHGDLFDGIDALL